MAWEHARHGITVNVVCPGSTDTALFEDSKQSAGSPGKLLDLPGKILFLSSSDAAFVTGQVLSVSGSLTMNG